jgi:hypothetical protein
VGTTLRSGEVDMNRSSLAQLVLESCPQLIIQALNQLYLPADKSSIFYISIISSSAMISFSLYRYLYWTFWWGVSFGDIPSIIQFNDDKRTESDSINVEFSVSLLPLANDYSDVLKLLEEMVML